MKKLKLGKKRKKIIITIIVCLVILIVLIIYFKLTRKNTNDTVKTEEIVINGIDNAYPNGTFYFSEKYNGKFEMNEISTRVSKFMTSSIPTLRKSLNGKSETEMREYYNDNLEIVQNLTGKISEDEFIELGKEIKTLNSENLNYLRSEYDTDNCTNEDKKFEVNLQIEYENEEPLIVKIVINDRYRTIKLKAGN